MIENQRIFDIAVAFLRKQKRRCHNGSICVYRDDYGNCCIAGLFIPDSAYNSSMEDGGLKDNYLVDNLLREQGFSRHNLQLLYELQLVHDSSVRDDSVKRCNFEFEELTKIAHHFNLDTFFLDLLYK